MVECYSVCFNAVLSHTFVPPPSHYNFCMHNYFVNSLCSCDVYTYKDCMHVTTTFCVIFVNCVYTHTSKVNLIHNKDLHTARPPHNEYQGMSEIWISDKMHESCLG